MPIGVGPKPLGALNVESLVPLPPGTLQLLERCADLLSRRLEEIGGVVDESGWQRAVKASVAISGVTGGGQAAKLLLGHLSSAARLDSAALVLDGQEGKRVTAAIGPLARPLSGLSAEEIEALSSLVGDIRSCYTAGDASGRGFAGTGSLRDGGARAVVVLPLWASRRRLGSIVLAHSRPVQLTSDDVTPLEMLSDHIASVLGATPATTPDLSAGAPLAQIRHKEVALQSSFIQRR